MFRHMKNDDKHKIFQVGITRLQAWADKWLLKFHPDKCKLLAIGKRTFTYQYTVYIDDLVTVALCHVETEKDVEVTFDEDVTFRQEIKLRATKANNIMRTHVYIYIYI